jgi:hypothetical protein
VRIVQQSETSAPFPKKKRVPPGVEYLLDI